MAKLNVKESLVGDITILRLDGKIVMGEESRLLRNVVQRLAKKGGKRKFILDVGGVNYIDSSGVGELVSSFTFVGRHGGLLILCNLTQKIADLLVITKLLTVYTVTDSVEEAVAAVLNDFYAICPLYRCSNLIIVPNHSVENLTCAFCGTEILLKPSFDASANTNQLAIISLRIPTYEQEYLNIIGVAPSNFTIKGRLDLFASDVVERAWYTVPPPRRILFDLGAAQEITPAGLQTLLNLCTLAEDEKGAIICRRVDGENPFARTRDVYERRESAIASLGDLSQVPEWNLIYGSFETLKAFQ